MSEPTLYEVLLKRAVEDLDEKVAKRVASLMSLVVGDLSRELKEATVEAYRRGVTDGFAQGVAAAEVKP